ncbi:putative protein kinase RLK-Pelle-LysM family [Rosa chinensis]|uniref:Protein kinase domain-containing protein n=1 Tax=Rosa chinensis TaxID=74649 RepID=A0A2P6R181_ROSCH|nr:putative protein kinase RLK-Pelle-LysM family [Rosa chinensis]
MASVDLLHCLILTVFLAFSFAVSVQTSDIVPFQCSAATIARCNASLYHINSGFQKEEIASFYSVNPSQVNPIKYHNKDDHLISVPCSCKSIFNTTGYFYDTIYKVKPSDTFDDVSNNIYSGQVLSVIEERKHNFTIGADFPIHLPCGCVDSDSQIVVTYTVQDKDTLTDIATLLSAKIENIESMNKNQVENPSYIQPGWVLFVPSEKNGLKKPARYRDVICCMLVYHEFVDATVFESDGPVVFSLEEIEEATGYFDESKIIGEGGYGKVYFGVLGEKEVAIKKMRSNMCKEFFAELKVLCKIHHINVVELLGYASGHDHLYLVYEYIQNGSLSEHLHDPLLKGHQPLSWTARTQIALDTAKGIEYIHDHTKARYVHRDIKTSNILLDEGLRAKVADFGLAKLVGRTNEEDIIATRLVGTPGYLPPESVQELQVTHKTDVFAFGVVLGELITGQLALFRDNREPAKMKSLITVIKKVFQDGEPDLALEAVTDPSLQGNYPIEEIFKMAEISEWCLSEEAVGRPEMREIVVLLSHIVTTSTEWEASLGGNSQVFSGLFSGR